VAVCTQLLKLGCLVCESLGEASIESRFTLPRRAKKIAEIQAKITDLSADVVDGQVLVQGTLHKQIFFVGDDHHVHHVSEDVPFAVFVDCPGAQAGMEATVTARIAKLAHSLEFCEEVVQKAIIQFTVQVTEECQVNVLLNPAGPLVRAECVVGEACVTVPVENVADLEKKAIKVRDVRVALEDVTVEVTIGQVLFQGTLVKSIFFIAEDDCEFFQEERVPFSGIADVPGAQPGDNAQIRVQIVRVDKFLTNGCQIRQRVVLSVFVKVTRSCEVNVQESATGPQVVAHKVVAANEKQVLVENEAPLTKPCRKVQEIQAKVEDLVCEVIADKVIISGNLHKQIFFVSKENIVRHMGEDIGFTTFVDLPGIRPGDLCLVDGLIEHVSFELVDGDEVSDEPDVPADPCEKVDPVRVDKVFRSVIQRTIIRLVVRGAQEVPVRVATLPTAAATPVVV
jgi:hypothetical protein